MSNDRLNASGKEDLWLWFSLSRASWLTLPRSMMHEMPDDWQAKMAELLNEWDATWDSSELPEPSVMGRENGKLAKYPEWLRNYRHPDLKAIESLRVKRKEGEKSGVDNWEVWA